MTALAPIRVRYVVRAPRGPRADLRVSLEEGGTTGLRAEWVAPPGLRGPRGWSLTALALLPRATPRAEAERLAREWALRVAILRRAEGAIESAESEIARWSAGARKALSDARWPSLQQIRGRTALALSGARRRELNDAWEQTIADRARAECAARRKAREARLRARRRGGDGGIVGWRGWRVGDDAILRSPSQETRWEGAELRAPSVADGRCVRGEAGIHSSWTRRALVCERYAEDVVGRVRAYGRVVAGPEGWRAERVVIDALWVKDASLVGALHARYGCAVRLANARWWRV